MTQGYYDSAMRHRADAAHLAGGERFQNAGHLIGLAAECLVKSLLEQAGVVVAPRTRFWRHFPDLGRRVVEIDGKSSLMRLLAPIVAKGDDFLRGWEVEDRYASTLSITDGRPRYESWEQDVATLFEAAGLP